MKTINADAMKEYINKRISQLNTECSLIDGEQKKIAVAMREELYLILDYIEEISSNAEKEDNKEYFDLEKAWEQTFELYPKKLGFALAKTAYLDKLGQVVEPNRKAVASLIWRAVKRYVEDYKERNAEDVNFRYMPKFEKWLNEDCDYWIKQIERR